MTDRTFIIMWDMLGLESIVDADEIEMENTMRVLRGDKPDKLGRIMHFMMMRARMNGQRHYEIYAIKATEGITEDDLRTMFEDNPQGAADMIRELGIEIYSDRAKDARQVIV